MCYLNGAGLFLRYWKERRDWMKVWTRPCPPLHPGIPAAAWLRRRSAGGCPHAQAPSLQVSLEKKGNK